MLTVALGAIPLGVVLQRLPWPVATHDTLGSFLGWLFYVELLGTITIVGLILLIASRIPRPRIELPFGSDWQE